LDIDLRARVPEEDRYHFFSNKVDYLEAKRWYHWDLIDNNGMNNSETGSLLVRQSDPIIYRYIIAHELWHELAMEIVQKYEATGDLIIDDHIVPPINITSGYTKTGIGLNEAVTDMFTRETLALMGINLTILGYQHHDTLLDSAIRETARLRHEHPHDIADPILRGALLGNYGFRAMRLTLGRDKMNALQRLTGRETRERLDTVADALSLTPGAGAIARAPFDWGV
jgi:hypothetical protein